MLDRQYTKIEGTNPVRHNTLHDPYIVQYLAEVQEHWLQQHPSLTYLIMNDANGYVPTHNRAFSQPLTGDVKIDTAKNRTKRIFTNRVGQSVAKHKEAFLLQTYQRHTGELMFDLPVPLYVNGRHWGWGTHRFPHYLTTRDDVNIFPVITPTWLLLAIVVDRIRTQPESSSVW